MSSFDMLRTGQVRCCYDLKAHGRQNSAQSKLGLEVDIVNPPTTQPRKALFELDIAVDTIIDIYNIGNLMLPQDRECSMTT